LYYKYISLLHPHYPLHVSPSSEAALRELFNEFDTDNSGFITPDNLRQLINDAGYADQVTDDEITELVAKVDTTGDGKISFEEFLAVFIDV
jgi:Ca2+-binding EF-hand superfamily protein